MEVVKQKFEWQCPTASEESKALQYYTKIKQANFTKSVSLKPDSIIFLYMTPF